ncbi:phosphoglycerate kinase [Desulfuromusa kysingii]|uniref:Phosphoglycerate kinase n=1 Tax=Desulfuromusa kysingii TaxID=37625 RepID=A0A1H4BCV9_9BACT|nr:phosphoglycerate kinase [Desulfuromusa kysingii]SEA45652.1 phosphoglycerate kinase [Desulfuromusa kysingii]
MLNKKTLKDINVRGKRVFCRCDFNVPIDSNGKITDDTRIQAALPTIRYLIEQGAKVILASHLGRPKGKPSAEFSLRAVATRLSDRLGQEVTMAPDCIGEKVQLLANQLQEGQVILLENVRFHSGETDNDPAFAAQLAALAEIYVNDAFGTAHRAHASTEGVARLLQPAVAGFLMEKELQYLGGALANPQRPFVAILGGAKVSDKITVIENLLSKVDTILIGGGMAYTFLKAQGVEVGQSLVEEDRIALAGDLLDKAQKQGIKFLLPIDHLVAETFAADSAFITVQNADFPTTGMGLDIGPATIQLFEQQITAAKTVVWNGPMGVFEFANFAKGTFAIAKALADSDCMSIIGGGDSVAAVNKSHLQQQMTHISTGGGASLEFLEGKTLPGIAALTDK